MWNVCVLRFAEKVMGGVKFKHDTQCDASGLPQIIDGS